MSVTSAVLRAKQTGTLNISQRDLASFPQDLCKIDEVRFENARWWEFVPITKIDASFNSFSALPDSLFADHNMHELVALSFAHNKISQLPSSIMSLGFLKQLNFSNNQLLELTVSFEALSALVELRLTGNRLKTAPAGLEKLENLQALYLDNNLITDLSKSLPRSLRILDVSSNKIDEICGYLLDSTSQVRTFNLSKNALIHLPDCIGALSKLTSLDLSQNLLEKLPNLSGLFAVDTFLCSHNKLRSLPKELPRSLTNLAADNNKITEFPAGLLTLENLVTLDLRNNDIKRVDPAFAKNRKSLVRFYLDGNPVREIPFAILKTGAVAILDFLKKRLEPEDELAHNGENAGNVKAPLVAGKRDEHELHNVVDLIVADKRITGIQVVSPSLKSFVVKNTPLESLPIQVTDGSLASLVQVDICKVALREIPKFNLPAVMTLRVSGCVINEVSLASFRDTPNLQELKLTMNRTKMLRVPAEVKINKLVTLDLEDNQLEEVDEALVTACPRLQQLMLMNNNVRSIPLVFGAWESLRTLSISGNPVKSIPQSTILKGTEAVKKVLKERLGMN